MSGIALSGIGLSAMLVLSILRVPVGVAMAVVGVAGLSALISVGAGLSILGQIPIRFATEDSLGLIPMFILMGGFAVVGGLGRELFAASNALVGHKKGGLAVATIWASAGFAAICGSAVASAATFAKVALPEMRRFNYDVGFACAAVAAGGTLGILIPPSVVLAIYGIMVEQDIAKLFIAGIVPGALAVAGQIIAIRFVVARHPELAPAGRRHSWNERLKALSSVWAVVLLLVSILGGMYGGIFTPTEAAAMGAGGALLIGVVRGRMTWENFRQALTGSAVTTGSIFIVIIGAVVFQAFLAVTQGPQELSEWIGGLELNRYVVLSIILLMYLFLGMVMDELAMILLTVPIVYPIMLHLGFDPIWFGVVLVITVELGLIFPPVAMNLFVLHAHARDIPLSAIFRSIWPFIAVDLVRLVLICAFPALATWLPSLMSN